VLLGLFALALVGAQIRISSVPELGARLELEIRPLMPARVYLFKDNQPFRLSPVDALLPLRVDLFYRERLWRNRPDPQALEVTCNDESHFFLLNGHATFSLPAGHYHVEAYRGLFFIPASAEFDLAAGEERRVTLDLKSWAEEERHNWISGDDHIHLTRTPEDNDTFLRWLEAEDLSIGNFLQLQRQMDAAAQYAFGPPGEAKRGAYSIRPQRVLWTRQPAWRPRTDSSAERGLGVRQFSGSLSISSSLICAGPSAWRHRRLCAL
jgi:hypothetical protein